jgi:A nuclease of the HNH/ENDO VII superfamily with conserved WHH
MSRRPEDGDEADGTELDAAAERSRAHGPGALEPRAIAPGKVTLTQRLAAPAGRPSVPGTLSPGNVTLTQHLVAAARPVQAPRGGSPSAVRVAEAAKDKGKQNAVIKVIVQGGGKVLQSWQSKARWEGPLPQRYTATRAGAAWKWDNSNARSIKVQTDERGGGGKSVEAWASPSGDRIVVYAQAIDAVTIDPHAEVDAMAPGHAKEKQSAGDGSTARLEQAGQGAQEDDAPEPRPPEPRPPEPHADGRAPDEQLADDKLADAFERELGIDLAGDTTEPDGAGEHAGRGDAGGARDGRRGDDTRRGGTGPGGEEARSTGKGRGSEDGRSAGGSEGGSRDGQQGGDEEGMYGGEGQHGDRGVPSAVALFGGIISVPAALRGFVEVALIISSGDMSGAGAQLFKRGLGKLASALAVRNMVAREARHAAVRETKSVIERLAKDKRTASAWAKATAEERDQVRRIVYWELQRKYFQGYLDAVKQAKARAKAALRKAPTSSDAQQSLQAAELAEEAATVSPVAGRLPQNHEFAGKQFPSDLLPPEYRKQGLRFTDKGFPDFEPHAMTLPNGKKYVEIQYMGSHRGDFAAATSKAGLARMPTGYTWHHSEELGRMYLVPVALHRIVRHTGGVATYKHVTGDVLSYVD